MALESRIKKLENIIQPDFHVPEGTLTRDDWSLEDYFRYSYEELEERRSRTNWNIPSRKAKTNKKLEDFY